MAAAADVIQSILAGDVDGIEDEVYNAIKRRRSIVALQKAGNFRVGDTVEFNRTTRPKYLQGVEGKVVKVNRAGLKVQMPESIPGDVGGRFCGYVIDAPIAIVDKV